MGSWTTTADTAITESKGLKVVLKNSRTEIFEVSTKMPRLAGQIWNAVESKNQVLSIGFWNQKGDWTEIANFPGGSWEYVRPL